MIINQIAQGSGGTTALAIYRSTDANGKILPPDTFMDLGNATDVGDHGLEYAFAYSTLTTADLSKLTAVSGDSGLGHCFHFCPNLTSVDVSNIETLTGSGCMSYFVTGCTLLTSITFNKLKTINANSGFNYAFRYSGIQTLSFPSLESVGYNNWSTMLKDITGCTIHLPTGLDPTGGSTVISSLSGYPNFGGTNTIVLFDIVQTLTGADTNSYVRSEKDSTSTANAWLYNSTLYYTSGTTEPQVGDTIYSDSACTTAVTTISAIA